MNFSEQELISIFPFLPSEQPTLVDVGAHVGSSSISFLRKGWRVIAFEPEPQNRAELETSLQRFDNVTIIPKAVSNQSGEKVPFYVSQEHWGIHSLKPYHETHKPELTVETVRLDETLNALNINEVTLLKIDIEGADFLALQGFNFDQIKPEIVMCEFADDRSVPNFNYSHYDVAKYMQDNGYRVFVSEWAEVKEYGRKGQITQPHQFLQCVEYPLDHQPAWGNLIFVRQDRVTDFKATLENYLTHLNRQEKFNQVLTESRQKLAPFRNKHKGERCVIIGNGPSLNKMDLSFLQNEITFGMNRIYLGFEKYDFTPTYYASVNPLVLEQSQDLFFSNQFSINFQSLNLIIFPDWQQDEEELSLILTEVLSAIAQRHFVIASHPQAEAITLIIDITNAENEGEIVKEFQAKYPHIIYHRTPERETLYAAWNRGIKMARGEYITNANTDDRFAVNALNVMSDELDSNSEIDAVYGDWLVTQTENDTFDSNNFKFLFEYPDFIPCLFFYDQITSHSALVRKDIFDKIGFYDPNYIVFGDRELMFRFCINGLKAKHISEIVGLYLDSPNSLEKNTKANQEFSYLREKYTQSDNFIKISKFNFEINEETMDNEKLSELYAIVGSFGKDFYEWNQHYISDLSFASQLFSKSLELDENNEIALNNIAIILSSQYQFEESISIGNFLLHEKNNNKIEYLKIIENIDNAGKSV